MSVIHKMVNFVGLKYEILEECNMEFWKRDFHPNSSYLDGNNQKPEDTELLLLNKQYQCPSCFKRYLHKTTLTRHLNVECGKEPLYKCPFCPQKSKQKGNMYKHIRNKHLNGS